MQLIDAQTRLPVSNAQVYQHFQNLTATGIFVKRRFNYDPSTGTGTPHPYTDIPMHAIISDITTLTVILATISTDSDAQPKPKPTRYDIPRADFHTLYELD